MPIKYRLKLTILTIFTAVFVAAVVPTAIASAGTTCGDKTNGNTPVTTSIDLGCKGQGNPIEDMIFAIIRLLSDGVGIVVVASIVVAGIQFTTSRGDPQASSKAIERIRSSVMALFIYIFAYAILYYLIPEGFFK